MLVINNQFDSNNRQPTNNKSQKCRDFAAEIECQQPDEFLYRFQGRMKYKEEVLPLNPEQLLLRVFFSFVFDP